MPNAAVGMVPLGTHEIHRRRGPGITVQSKAAVELFANFLRIGTHQRNQGRLHITGHALDDDSDLLNLVLDVAGGHETALSS